jgi:hypothetical protein
VRLHAASAARAAPEAAIHSAKRERVTGGMRALWDYFFAFGKNSCWPPIR